MKAWIAHVYLRTLSKTDERVLTIFSPGPHIAAEFDAVLSQQISTIGVVDAVHIVGYRDAIRSVSEWLREVGNVSIERLKNAGIDINRQLRLFTFAEETGLHVVETHDGKDCTTADLLQWEQHGSLLEMFRGSGGEERAPLGTHYAKTSDRHADRFLRVSNVVEDAAHVQLIAFWLLPHLWSKSYRHVIVDTSGIFSVALTAVHEAMARGGLAQKPAVWSHRSHEGIAAVSTQQATDSLFLVSASTSDGLLNKIIGQGGDPHQVVTLFRLSPEPSHSGCVLCDLKGIANEGLKPIENRIADTCTLCAQNQHVIQIQGDQFAISPPELNVIEILAGDFPKAYRAELSALAGLGIFVAYRRHGDRIATLAVRVAPLLQGELASKSRAIVEKKRERWEAVRRLGMTLNLRSIISASYPGSASIAEGLAADIAPRLHDPSQAQIVTPLELRALPPSAHTSAVVASACIDDGKEMLAVSRTLRKVQEHGAIRYLCCVMMIAPEREANRLLSNLTYGAHGKNTFQLEPLLRYEVECYEETVSWDQELAVLRRLCDWADRSDEDIPRDVEARIARLQEATAEGLTHDLFWPDLDSQPLKLRSDFTLLDETLSEPPATQADLFAVFCMTLTSLRLGADPKRRLQHNSYERAILAPSNFDRFSDGVLQACLLRAARPKELAYGACDPRHSCDMRNILLYALSEDAGSDKAEAIVEFLLALLTGRMSLQRSDLLEVCEAVLRTAFGMTATAKLLSRYLLHLHTTET